MPLSLAALCCGAMQVLRTGRRNGVSMADVTHSCGQDKALGDFGTGFWLIGQPNDMTLNFRVRHMCSHVLAQGAAAG